ncbi:uncharacterized protein ARMOST_21166 [Armillaria ostoyae]|uniref:Uncharacterized protein n=1 Tax=Armillaria ostoyae TaxID=47428 RepID=A0A284S9C4_ARMOS|nr:uncharacterized protein ARMOST_21166 [Armillaria ostoyae]
MLCADKDFALSPLWGLKYANFRTNLGGSLSGPSEVTTARMSSSHKATRPADSCKATQSISLDIEANVTWGRIYVTLYYAKAFLFHSYTHILDYLLENPAPVRVDFVPHRRAFRVDVPCVPFSSIELSVVVV